MQHTTRIRVAVVLSAIALFTACKKDDDNSKSQTSSLGKATITGKVHATLVDTMGAADAQYAPSGTQLQAWIDTRDLTVVPASTPYPKRFYTVTVDGSGNYSFSIDVSKNQSATVHIEPNSFAADVVKKMFPDSVYKERHVFYPMYLSPVSVNAGSNNVIDIEYN